METSLDFLTCALEEIALEGLDGITLPTLWIRLENRPNFPIALDEYSKRFIWECVAVHKDIEIYLLPEPRPTVQTYNRYDTIDPELGIFMEPKSFQEIYPMAVIDDGINKGSCETYETRECITSKIRHSNMLLVSLSQAFEEWDQRLVLVSSPKARLTALIGSEINPLIDLPKEGYAVLERIGRSRYHGETTNGEHGLISLKPVNRHIHYYLSKLHSKGLITKQRHYLKSSKDKCLSGQLLHLTRFFVRKKTKFDTLLEMMSDILKDKPNHRELSKVLREELGLNERTFKKVVYKCNQKWFQFCEVPFSEMFPDSSYEERCNAYGMEKVAKVVQMVQPYDSEEEIFFPTDDAEDNVDAYVDSSKLSLDKPILCIVYRLIENAGHGGLSINEVMKKLTLPRLDVRQMCKQLVKLDEVITVMVDQGRQRAEKYICKKFESESAFCVTLKEQTEKLKGHHSNLVADDLDENPLNEPNSFDSSQNVSNDKSTLKVNQEASEEEQQRHENDSALQEVESKVVELSETNDNYHTSSQVTARILNRCNTIVDYLKKSKIATIFELLCSIYESERNEGYKFKADKKSLKRLLWKLSKEGHVKIIRTVLKQEDKTQELEFICNPSVKPDDVVLQSAVEQAKFKFFRTDKDASIKPVSKPTKRVMKDVGNVPKAKKIKSNKEPVSPSGSSFKTLPAYANRRLYGLLPKFVRAKTLHLLLYYLIYDYEGECEKEYAEPFVYHKSENWKRYLPCLPQYKKKGWCILADIIPRMPLSIFVKIVNMMYEIPELDEILKDPEKQHYLLKHLPPNLQNVILGGRRYIFRIFDVLHMLCWMGLVTLGPRLSIKDKEQAYIYLHQHAKIKDTTVSPASHLIIDQSIEYEFKEYHLKTLSDVETYWIDLETTCICTLLGKYGTITPNAKQSLPSETSQLIEACQHKDFDEVCDTGVIPGDGLGAAGLDSSLFSHLRRNWCWFNQNLKPALESKYKMPSITSSVTLQRLFGESSQTPYPGSQKRLQRMTERTLDPPNKHMINSTNIDVIDTDVKKIFPMKRTGVKGLNKKIRIYKSRKRKSKRQPYYDEKDKAAIKTMDKLRTDWTAQEDSFLLVCKVTSMFLDPKCKGIVVHHSFIRDLLHERFSHRSLSKTSRACQRRLRYILLNSDTRNSVAVFLGEAMQDADLVKEFDTPKHIKRDQEEWKNMFKKLFYKLLDKLSTSSPCQEATIVLPNSLKCLQEQYNIFAPKINIASDFQHMEPKSIDDICYEVIRSLVFLALAIDDREQRKWAYHLCELYEQYPKYMLQNVLDQFHKDHLIANKSIYKRKIPPPSLRCGLYRFSVIYENCFLTKYPAITYTGAKELLEKLKHGGVFPEVQLECDLPVGYTPVLMALSMMKQIELCIEIPDQIIVFNSPVSGKRSSNVIEQLKSFVSSEDSDQLMRLCNVVERPIAEVNASCEREAKRIKLDETVGCDILSQVDDSENKLSFQDPVLDSNESFTETHSYSASRLGLNILRQETSISKIDRFEHSHDYIALNSCQLSCKMKTLPETHTFILNPKKVMQQPKQDKMYSYVVGKEFNMKAMHKVISKYSSYVPPEMFALTDFSDLLQEAYKLHSPEILVEGEKILGVISSTECMGISYEELCNQLKNINFLSVYTHINILLKSLLIIRVGIVSFRYVCVKYSKVWLLSSFMSLKQDVKQPVSDQRVDCVSASLPVETSIEIQQHSEQVSSKNAETALENVVENVLKLIIDKCEREKCLPENNNVFNENIPDFVLPETEVFVQATCVKEAKLTAHKDQKPQLKTVRSEPVYFVPRIWRKPDGSLNKSSFVKYLQTILSFIMSMPGVSEKKICERFSLISPPVQILELLELLCEVNCIFKYNIKQHKPLTLFAPLNSYVITESPELGDEAHYEPFVDAILKISNFEKSLHNACFD